jgi:tetratricopeptide (TPR) repeat protein/TolB-like protein
MINVWKVVALSGAMVLVTEASLALEGAGEERRVTLAVGDFEMVGAEEQYEFLERGFAELVHVALLRFKEVEVIARGELWRALRELRVPRAEYGEGRIFANDILDHVGVELVLSGEYFERLDRLQVIANIERRQGEAGEADWIKTGASIRKNHILQDIGVFAVRIVKAMEQGGLLPASAIRLVGIRCLVLVGDSSLEEGMIFARDLALSLASQISSRTSMLAELTEDEVNSCGSRSEPTPPSDDEDAVVSGTLTFDRDHLMARPTLSIPGTDSNISVPAVEGSKGNYGLFKTRVIENVELVIDAGQTEEGRHALTNLYDGELTTGELVERGKNWLDRNERSLALLFFEQALATSGGAVPDAFYHIGAIRASQGRASEAIEAYQAAIEADPHMWGAHTGLAEAYTAENRYSEALAIYRRLLELSDPSLDKVRVRRELGRLYWILGKYDEARAAFNEVLSKEPEDVDALQALAELARRQRQWRDAVTYLERALETFPEDDPRRARMEDDLVAATEAWSDEAWRAGDYEAGIRAIDRGIRVKPRAVTYFYRALLSARVATQEGGRNYEGAIKDYRMALERGLSQTRERDALLNLTELYILSGEYDNALRLTEKAFDQARHDTRESELVAATLEGIARTLTGEAPSTAFGHLEQLKMQEERSSFGFHWCVDMLKSYMTKLTLDSHRRDAIVRVLEDIEEAIDCPRESMP